jgi:hypothetical protein
VDAAAAQDGGLHRARARDGSEQRASQAMALAQVSGSDDAECAQAQRQAATRIATKTAEEIRAKGASLAEGAIEAASDASTQLDGTADAYHTEIDTAYDDVLEQLGQVPYTSASEISTSSMSSRAIMTALSSRYRSGSPVEDIRVLPFTRGGDPCGGGHGKSLACGQEATKQLRIRPVRWPRHLGGVWQLIVP